MSSPSKAGGGDQGNFVGTGCADATYNSSVPSGGFGGTDHHGMLGMNSPIETSPISVAPPIKGAVGVSFEQVFSRLVLSETQSQYVDGTEQVTQEWMVPEQLRAYELKRRNKVLRFECDSKQHEDKEKLRRDADATKGARYGKTKQRDLQKKSLSSVGEQGGTPQRSPRVACMDKNLGKRTVETVQMI